MKNKIFAILLIASFMMIVIHEMIPHHHYDMDDIELFSHQQHSNKQESNSDTSNTNHLPFPNHQHVSAYESFDIARSNTEIGRNFNFSTMGFFLTPNYLSCFPETEPPEILYYTDFSSSISSLPFIISPNAMRGSPSVA